MLIVGWESIAKPSKVLLRFNLSFAKLLVDFFKLLAKLAEVL